MTDFLQRKIKHGGLIPHKEPLQCAIGSLALVLVFMFDEENLCAKVPGWKWNDYATFRDVSVKQSCYEA